MKVSIQQVPIWKDKEPARRRGRFNPVTEEEKKTMKEMYSSGYTISDIARRTHRSREAVGRSLGRSKPKIEAFTNSEVFNPDTYLKSLVTI